jgi:hypothetical protein
MPPRYVQRAREGPPGEERRPEPNGNPGRQQSHSAPTDDGTIVNTALQPCHPRVRGKPPGKAMAPTKGATTEAADLDRQLSQQGSGSGGKGVKGDAVDRFWAKVEKTPTCWLWHGETRKGCGRFAIYEGGRRRRIHAHRWIYGQLVEPLVDGLEIEHLCHNRACVRPAHLDQVTSWENQRRGFSPWAINARKTRCERGHSLVVRPDGRGTQCRECIRVRRAAHKAKLRQARRAA